MKSLLGIARASLIVSVVLTGLVIVWILVGLPQSPALWRVYSFGQAAAVVCMMFGAVALIVNQGRDL